MGGANRSERDSNSLLTSTPTFSLLVAPTGIALAANEGGETAGLDAVRVTTSTWPSDAMGFCDGLIIRPRKKPIIQKEEEEEKPEQINTMKTNSKRRKDLSMTINERLMNYGSTRSR
jgi:hypothetical protein